MYDNTINLLEELDNASQIHHLQRDDIDALMLEFATRITKTLHIERLSVWLLNSKKDALISFGEYDTRTNLLKKDDVLKASDFPAYFTAIRSNKIILAPDIVNDPNTFELTLSYSTPNNVVSLMDVPLRIMGEIVGVMCFEKTGKIQRNFTHKEQTFAFSLGLVFSSNLEARHRRAAQAKLEMALKEKEMLIKEINHRVKNNFTVLTSLLRLSKNQSKSDEVKTCLDEYEHRILSMMKIHDLLSQTPNQIEIPLGNYLHQLVLEFKNSHPEISKNIHSFIAEEECYVDSSVAINLGLIITEVFLNAVKYAFMKDKETEFHLNLIYNNAKHVIEVGNSGKGFAFFEKMKEGTLGLELIHDLSQELCEKTVFPDTNSCFYTFHLIKKGSV